jgi:hypothetical protein
MQARRSLGWTGALLALGWLAPIAGCLSASTDGDPGAGFLTGAAGATGAGAYTGAAGASAVAGATGAAGAGGAPQACTTAATGAVQIAWTLEDAAGAGTTCAAVPDSGSVTVSVRNLDTGVDSGRLVGCEAMRAVTCALPPGNYALSMKLLGGKGSTLAEIVAPFVFVTAGETTDLGSLPFRTHVGAVTDGAGFALTWSIDAADTGAPLSCDEATAKTVRLKVGAQTFDLPCAAGMGRTTTVAPGSYPVSVILLDAQNMELSVTQTMTVTIGAGQLVFLGDVLFDVI